MDIKKTCNNCKYTDVPSFNGPCNSCNMKDNWEPTISISRYCKTCKYKHNDIMEKPCDTCVIGNNYEAIKPIKQEKEELVKNCPNCRYDISDVRAEPCESCNEYSNWKSKKREKEKIKTNPFDRQVGGNHYKDYPYCEPAEFLTRNKISSDKGHVIRYTLRHDSKNGIEDLKKAKHYLEIMAWCHYGENI